MSRSLTSFPRRLALGVALLATLGLGLSPATAQTDDTGQAGGMPAMGRPAQMDKMHFMEGNWNVKLQIRTAPQAPWQSSDAHALVEPVLDGCALREDFKGTVMGMPFQGLSLATWNRETKRFESMWLDSMGARMSTMHGDFDADGNLVMEGESMQNGKPVQVRSVSRQVAEDTVDWSMEVSQDGKTWFETMKMTYSRVD